MPVLTIGEVLIVVGLALWTIYSFIKVAGGVNGQKAFDNYIVNFLTSLLTNSAKLLANLEGQLAPIVQVFVSAFQTGGAPLAAEIRAPVETFVQGIFNEATSVLTALGESNPDGAIASAAAAMAQAFGTGFASFGVSAAFESVFPEKLNVLNGAGPMLAEMAGFAEVAEAVRDPLYRNAFGRSLDYHFRSVFKPELPDEADAVTWHSRRLLTDAQLQTIFNFSGLKTEYEAPFIASAYRAVQPRALATLFQDTDVPVAAMRAALQFAGIRDQEINLMLPAFVWNATKNVRGEYISALVRSAELGTVSMQELTQELTTLGYSAAASDLIQLTVATRKELQLAELYRKSISEAYRYGTITDAQYVPSLEAIGISAADAQAHYAVDSIAKTGKAAIAALKAEERIAAQRMRAAGQAAIAGYKSGTIDAAALEAALLLAGYDPTVAGFAVTVQTLKRQGNEVFVYGVMLPRSAAVLLREQVSALGVQVKARLVTPPAALQALAGYGVPTANAQALVAEWTATHTPAADVGVLEPR
jgi:hypothetical protein